MESLFEHKHLKKLGRIIDHELFWGRVEQAFTSS